MVLGSLDGEVATHAAPTSGEAPTLAGRGLQAWSMSDDAVDHAWFGHFSTLLTGGSGGDGGGDGGGGPMN